MERYDKDDRPYCDFCDALATIGEYPRQVLVIAPIDEEGEMDESKEQITRYLKDEDWRVNYYCAQHAKEHYVLPVA